MTLKQIIKYNYATLVRSIDPSIDLLGRLRSVPFVEDRITSVKKQTTDQEKNDALLDALLEVPDNSQESVMNGFISALRSSGQDHVANIFRRENDKAIMSDEHYELLMRKRFELCKCMNPRDVLINSRSSFEIFSEADEQKILSKATLNDKIREMVETLLRKSDDAFQQFITLLHETMQSHVAYILTGEGNSQPLKEEHRTRLLSTHREYLVTIDSQYSGLMTSLMGKGVFSSYDKQCVDDVQPQTNYDRNEIILDLIAKKSQSDFFNFISALNDTGQMHVAVALIGADVVAKIKTVYEPGADVDHVRDVDADLLEYMREMFQRDGEVVRKINRILTRNGVAVSGVGEGCIEVTFTCQSVESLHSFRHLCDSGELQKMINEVLCSQFAEKGLKSIMIVISNDQFEHCAQTFARWIPMTSEHREALLSSQKLLVNELEVNGGLLDKLSLCKRRREAIESAGDHDRQVKTLIDIVSRQPDSGFTQLLHALIDTKQTKAAAIIRGGTKREMKSEDSELPETVTADAWKEVDHKLGRLLLWIRKFDPYQLSTMCSIFTALKEVLMTFHNLSKQTTILMSIRMIEEAIAEKIELLLQATKSHSAPDPDSSSSSLTATHVIPTRFQVSGVTSLGDDVFVVHFNSQQKIEVYHAKTFTLQRHITVPDFSGISFGLAACPQHYCLYAADSNKDSVHRVDLSREEAVISWSVGRWPTGLSVNSLLHLLVVSRDERKLQIFTTHGTLIQNIQLQADIEGPRHAVQLPTGLFLVSHSGSLHRVCLLGADGVMVCSYGGQPGSYLSQMNYPAGLAVDRAGRVLVADWLNNRLLVIDQSLSSADEMSVSVRGGLDGPYSLWYDQSRRRLHISEWYGAQVIVIDNLEDFRTN